MPTQPNILYIVIEHTKFSASSLSGNPQAHDRFTKQMAAKGVTFTNAYSASPICTPSRATVMTGVYPLVHQATCHQNRVPWNLPQLPELLQQAGYYTCVAGHYEPARNLSRGWHEQVEYREPGPLGYAKDIMTKFHQTHPKQGWVAGTLDCPMEKENSVLLTDRMIRMIDQAKASKAPYFFHACYADPDTPNFAPPPYDTLVAIDDLPLPPQGDDTTGPKWLLKAREEARTAEATEHDIKKVVAMYYGMIALVNNQMQRLYDAMAERHMLENTWVIIASDHGDYCGEKGLFNQSESLYECLLHVPLVIVPPPGVNAPRGMTVEGLVELIDLFPTILNSARAKVPKYAQGHDLISWIQGGARKPLRDCVFSQVGDYHGFLHNTYPTGVAASGRHPSLLQSARNFEYSYVRDPDYDDEAYDLGKDPKELVNLLRDQGGKELSGVTELRRRVDAFEKVCLRLRDQLGVIPGDRGFVEGWE